MDASAKEINIEVDLVLEAIFRCCGYDFRQYAKGSITRNLQREVDHKGLNRISELLPLIIYDADKLHDLVHNLSIGVTDFFRDAQSYQVLVDQVFPTLRSFPFIKVWHAGCSNGKEVYSLAMLLNEAGLLERCLIYATDISHASLKVAKKGIYSREEVDEAQQRYLDAGGNSKIQDHFNCHYDVAQIESHIRKRITFAHHNLAADNVFGEMQLIICKNVLIYFDKNLKQRVIQLFHDSLSPSGYVMLGTTESIDLKQLNRTFKTECLAKRLYKKIPLTLVEAEEM